METQRNVSALLTPNTHGLKADFCELCFVRVYRTKRRFVGRQSGTGAERGSAPWGGTQAHRQGRSPAGGDGLRQPPEGRARWTLELLADAMVKLTEHGSLSGETVRRRLAENGLNPWRKDMWCIPRVDGEYVARLEDVLDLNAEAPDPRRPVVCFDESPVQLIGEVRQPIPAEPGQLERYDCEYRRNGTVNLFVCVDVHRPWRKVKVTERRAAEDYAQCMRELIDVHYPDAACIRVVQDNLSSHSAGALYEVSAFGPHVWTAFGDQLEIGISIKSCVVRKFHPRKLIRAHFSLPIFDEKHQKNKRPDERENAPRFHAPCSCMPRIKQK
jgi:DDE superfamily endonuclease